MAKTTKKEQYMHAWLALAVARVTIGFVFFWAFIDKMFGLGFATPAAKAWVNGGSPTSGYLKGVEGPFADFFNSLAGIVAVDWLFMVGLLGVGLALILGMGLRVAAVTGSALLLFMWAASLPIKTNPFVDDHIVYALVLWAVAAAPRKISCANWWLSQPAVKKNSWLW